MTLAATGSISMLQIEAEYNDQGTLGNALGSYYGRSRGLPASGAISFDDFRGQDAFGNVTIGTWVIAGIFTAYGWGFFAQSGSIDNLVFLNGTTLTLESVYWVTLNEIQLTALGTNINSDASFKTLRIGNTSYARADAGYDNDQGSTGAAPGYSRWRWASANTMGTSGTQNIAFWT